MTINVFGGGSSGGPVFPLQRSVRLRSSNSAYFNRTPASAATLGTKFTWSAWVKRGALGTAQALFAADSGGGTSQALYFETDNTLKFATGATNHRTSTAVFRDPSAWYHIVVVADSTTTGANRLILYVNNVQQTWTGTDPTINGIWFIGKQSTLQGIGLTVGSSASTYFDGYLTEVNFIDGQALTPTSFGSYNSITGVWQPIRYSGTYGTNGFYLNFNDNSNNTAATIGKDSSGNGNNWTPNGISVTAGVTYDSMLDVPTLTSATNANFAVLSQVDKNPAITLAQGNLSYTASNNRIVKSTISVNSGKWYWEFISGNGATGSAGCGIVSDLVNIYAAVDINTSSSGVVYRTDGNKSVNGTSSAYGSSYTSSNVIGIALDCDTNSITFYRDNTSQGSISITSGLSWFAAFDQAVGTNYVNFGQRPFTYTPPTGFKSLNTYNLPTPTIPNGAANFAATLYTGTGSSLAIANTVNGKSFQPDLVWVKGRSGATDHALYDSVRGTTKDLVSNSTAAETTQATGLTAFDTGGFTVGALAKLNTNTSTYVGWQWKASGTTTNIAVGSVSSGIPSIASTVSANPSAGFSIVTYTANNIAGATVGHGLNVAPKFIITKNRDNGSTNWATYHQSIGATKVLLLNSALGEATTSTSWNNAAPSSTVFTVSSNPAGGGYDTNYSTQKYVAYCFSEIAGYSKFGSYTGNNSATDGTFVYLGFRPRFLIIKSTSASTSWVMVDSSRNTYNLSDTSLYAESANSEATIGTVNDIDFLSNGFKLRNNTGFVNASQTYVYAAFAESPFNYSLAR